MEFNLLKYDFERNIRNYEYTKRVTKRCRDLFFDDRFNGSEEAWAEGVLGLLLDDMEIVVFSDYLKRYIRLNTVFEEERSKLEDSFYEGTIRASFRERKAPFSFTPSNKRPGAYVNSWLNSKTVSRNTIFVLGFGLDMSDTDVSDFLTKVLKESDFDFNIPEEVIYWYCYHFHYRYRKATELLAYMESIPEVPFTEQDTGIEWKSIIERSDFDTQAERYLKQYLAHLKMLGSVQKREQETYEVFMKLYERCRNIVADEINMVESRESPVKGEDITDAQLEREIYCGIPNEDGNIKKMQSSLLSEVFQDYRINRQRFFVLKTRKRKVNRFDLITLEFFIYCSENVETDTVYYYYPGFIKTVNEILGRCGMGGLYSVNPYETFILLCLLSEDPLQVFSAVWHMSFERMKTESE